MWLDVFNEVVERISEFGFVLAEHDEIGKCCFSTSKSYSVSAEVYLTLVENSIDYRDIIRVERINPSFSFLDVDVYKHDSIQSISFRVMSAMCVLFDFDKVDCEKDIHRGMLDLMVDMQESGKSCIGAKLSAGDSCTFRDLVLEYKDDVYSDIVVSCRDSSNVIATVYTEYEEPRVMVMFTLADSTIFLDISVEYSDKTEHFTYDSTFTRL